MLKVQSALSFFFIALVIFSRPTQGQIRFNPTGGPLPLWEAGVGVVHAIAPDYPGAEQSTTYTIPFPAAFTEVMFLGPMKMGVCVVDSSKRKIMNLI